MITQICDLSVSRYKQSYSSSMSHHDSQHAASAFSSYTFVLSRHARQKPWRQASSALFRPALHYVQRTDVCASALTSINNHGQLRVRSAVYSTLSR
ncbi:hypothetical protein BaRGS_00012054 [Batillaria attramentaria]|uniref:Uncharacterized protein n=1 Tax=Batillaria attramentaria TaxID=370345 RepID=A0ABD0LCD9_9CAEN